MAQITEARASCHLLPSLQHLADLTQSALPTPTTPLLVIQSQHLDRNGEAAQKRRSRPQNLALPRRFQAAPILRQQPITQHISHCRKLADRSTSLLFEMVHRAFNERRRAARLALDIFNRPLRPKSRSMSHCSSRVGNVLARNALKIEKK